MLLGYGRVLRGGQAGMKKVGIADEEGQNVWLSDQTAQVRTWFATRCALRALPGLGPSFDSTFDDFALVSFRAVLIAATVSTCKPRELEKLGGPALASAATIANFVADSKSDDTPGPRRTAAWAARNAAFDAHSAISGHTTGPGAVQASNAASHVARMAAGADTAEAAVALIRQAASADIVDPATWPTLWPDGKMPIGLSGLWNDMKISMQAAPEKWAFWLEWYRAILDGNPLDWALTQRIALDLTEEQWDAGPQIVARRIREIQRTFYTSIGPQLVQTESGKWGFERDANIPAEPLGYAIDSVRLALNAATLSGTQNGFSEDAAEYALIISACDRHSDHPSLVATTFWNACMSLQRNIGDVYPEDASLIALRNQLYVSVGEICEQDDLVRDRVAKLAALETRRYPTKTEKAELATLPVELREDLTFEALEAIEEAVDVIRSTEKPARFWRARLVNWVTTLGRGIERGQKAEKKAMWLLKLGKQIAGWFFDED
ncbi:hypothetical protein [Sedimentitalea todarodis]|uniref:Type I-E CRISPR-associated protein Cse1/CasA n=1 Tax=Sedimentitalea todarodis TaxID=1631240 RepID=A0ABU3VCV4_9RHOB|nr:hypothetical protein [Sedimentitalea todarodis]MDU9004008.1 hypothetical protein [Sedimentitalea todarodis]